MNYGALIILVLAMMIVTAGLFIATGTSFHVPKDKETIEIAPQD